LAVAFNNQITAIRWQSTKVLNQPRGPADFNPIDLASVADADQQARIASR
jgi:hypothetical protein